MPRRTRKEQERRNAALAELIGKRAAWKLTTSRNQQVEVLVRICDARYLWDRIDVQIETDLGTKTWASLDTVHLVGGVQSTAN